MPQCGLVCYASHVGFRRSLSPQARRLKNRSRLRSRKNVSLVSVSVSLSLKARTQTRKTLNLKVKYLENLIVSIPPI